MPPTSPRASAVHLIRVLRRFEKTPAAALRVAYRAAHASVRLSAMFLLETEIAAAGEAFAVKFADILTRHRVIFGSDPFATLRLSREAARHRVKQVLINLVLRLRERYALLSLNEEQLALVIAEAASPLRSAAASLLALETGATVEPREALLRIVAELGDTTLSAALDTVHEARERGTLPPGTAEPAVFALIEI